MAFTQDQLDKIVARIREKSGQPGGAFRACPICGRNNWVIQRHGLVYFVLQTSGPGVLELGGPRVFQASR
jgi:hypothetical protein